MGKEVGASTTGLPYQRVKNQRASSGKSEM